MLTRRALVRLLSGLAAAGWGGVALGERIAGALLPPPLPAPLPSLPSLPHLPAPESICDETFACGVHEECDVVMAGRTFACHRFRVVRFCSRSFPEVECDQQAIDLGPDNCCG